MTGISRYGRTVALILLIFIALYAAHFTARIKIANEHVALSRAMVHVPFSGAIGQAIICGYGRLWNVQCADDERVTALNLSIRYLCAANPAAQSMECADRNMVGTAAVLTIAAGLIAAAAAWVDARRPRNGGAAVSALARYGICAATSLLMLWQLSRVVLPTIWIGSLDERIIASRPILAFTGSVIGYGLLIALAAIGLAGAAAAALARMRR